MGTKRIGKAIIQIDGSRVEALPGANCDLGGDNRTTVKGSNEILGFSAEPQQSKLEVTVSCGEGTSARDFDKDNISYIFESDTGQLWSCPKAWCTTPPSVSAGNTGGIKLTFEGLPCVEVI